MTTKPLIVGMIGVANFGAHRRSLLRKSGRFQVAAVCDRNPDALAKAAAEESAQPYTDFAALLRQPGLEGIVVSTGADSHAPLAIAALLSGKHVFVEKPLCPTVAEVNELRKIQRETGKVIGVGHAHCPTDGLYQLVRQTIDSGKLGVVATYEENSSHSGGLVIKPGDWRGLADRNPGGMLFQCGVHALHGLNWLFSPITAVQAMLRYDANPVTQTADVANVLLRHENGLIGTLNCYHVTAYCHELRVFGTKGNLYCDTFQRKAWFQERRNGPIEDRIPLEIPASDPQHDCAGLNAWYDAICAGTAANYPSLEDGAKAVLPVFAAELAAQDRREVSLSEISTCR